MSAPFSGHGPQGLAALEARLRQDLSWLELPAKPWVAARMVAPDFMDEADSTHTPSQTHPPNRSEGSERMLDVAIIGGGMAGLAAAGALKLLGIATLVFDRAAEGFEGPWATTARMETLRSPKQLTGPALGLPALTFRAWFEAQFGEAAWAAMDKIPRLQWMDYLRWYRRALDIEVKNEHNLLSIRPQPNQCVLLEMHSTERGRYPLLARRVVLATGRDGLGSAWVPPFAQTLSPARWVHSSDVFDYRKLKGKRVGVIGGGSSSMDSAATALEAGAASVDLIIRRHDLPRINKGKGAGSPGLTLGYYGLPDSWKWRYRRYINSQQVPPPRGSTLRVSGFSNARFHLGAPVLKSEESADGIRLTTPKGPFNLDFLVFSTGFRVNFGARPELANIAPHIRLWASRYEPEELDADPELSECPDVGPAFEFQEHEAGVCPGLDRVHSFCYPAVMSQGQVSGDIPAISDGAQRLAQGIAAHFFQEDVASHYAAMERYAEPELQGDEWKPSS